jgi:cobalt-zinc-cadmium efflux system membrane fusion protein
MELSSLLVKGFHPSSILKMNQAKMSHTKLNHTRMNHGSGQNTMCALVCTVALLCLAACDRRVQADNKIPGDTGPTPARVVPDLDSANFNVEHPERFPLVDVTEHRVTPELSVTGVVSPDVSRQVPVPSLASGRVIEISTRLGDTVQKGQLLFRVRSSDIAGAFSDYRKAVRNEELTKIQLNRAELLFEHGAAPKSQLETAQAAEDNAKVDVETTREHLGQLGSDPDHPTGIVDVIAPEAGIITDQQISISSGVQALATPNPFTISDTSHVWILCDVYENDMAQVHLGDAAEIRLAAYPDRMLRARVANILPTLDPAIRTTKVRLELDNPGYLRFGMFITATFRGQQTATRAVVPAAAILHLHDRDWVFVPLGEGRFRRVEVTSGNTDAGGMQEVMTGLKAGDRVVGNALTLQSTVEP